MQGCLDLGPRTREVEAVGVDRGRTIVDRQRSRRGAEIGMQPAGAQSWVLEAPATARLGSSEIALTIANATAIELRRDPSSGAWASSSFRLDSDDPVEGRWSAELGATRWR